MRHGGQLLTRSDTETRCKNLHALELRKDIPMRLMNFEADGLVRYGVVEDEAVIDLSTDAERASGLASLIAREDWRAVAGSGRGRRFSLDSVRILPPVVSREAKVLALGWAYADHRAETGREPDAFPSFFMKHVDTLVGHREPLLHPGISHAYDFEGEFAVVIGKTAHRIAESDVFDHIAGYTILMDGSVRDWQKHSVTAGKNFDRSSSCGPFVVTSDEIADPHDLELTTILNGTVMQKANTGLLLWSVPYLVSYCSTFTTLRPGDIISTGTPGGVGHKRSPQVFMKSGDRLSVSISGIGVLENTIEDAP